MLDVTAQCLLIMSGYLSRKVSTLRADLDEGLGSGARASGQIPADSPRSAAGDLLARASSMMMMRPNPSLLHSSILHILDPINMTRKVLDVAIIGSGIGGLSAAIALRRQGEAALISEALKRSFVLTELCGTAVLKRKQATRSACTSAMTLQARLERRSAAQRMAQCGSTSGR